MCNRRGGVWKAILKRRDILSLGAFLQPYHGAIIDIWNDPWFPSLPRFRPRPRVTRTYVNVLWINELTTESGEWNRQLIQHLFEPASVRAILKIPVVPIYDDGSKKWLWALSSSGSFTVKSMYQAILFSQLEESSHQDQLIWKALWKAKLHPRHKLLWWRICHNILPTRVQLSERFDMQVTLCPLYCTTPEMAFHLF